MTLAIVHILVGLGSVVFFLLFSMASRRERRPRALRISLIAAAAVAIVWALPPLLRAPAWIAAAMDLGVLIFGVLFFAPIGKTRPIAPNGPIERVDERDAMFSREDYLPGDGRYEAYYERRPELKAIDDRIRRLPRLLAPGGLLYDPVLSTQADAIFKICDRMVGIVDGPVAERPEDAPQPDPARLTAEVAAAVEGMGAAEVGVCELDPAWVYSHVGRGPEPWGAPIEPRHRYAIVFTLEMDFDKVEQAPAVATTWESARQYLNESVIAVTLAQWIRDMGFPARAHVSGSNYQVMLPPLAVAAGLGELGRLGYFISRRKGARVRLGAVTTDLPLIPNAPEGARGFGAREFCEVCKRCADICPAGAIPRGGMETVRGVEKWPMRTESCLHYWRVLGTDCGLCMKICPYSHPETFVHRVVRTGIARSAFARRVAVLGEDLFYGRTRQRTYCNISSVIGREEEGGDSGGGGGA